MEGNIEMVMNHADRVEALALAITGLNQSHYALCQLEKDYPESELCRVTLAVLADVYKKLDKLMEDDRVKRRLERKNYANNK